MNALYLDNGQLTLRTDYPDPQPRPGEALIAVTLAGICSTDLELVKGYLPFTGVLGHEFVGVVTAVGSPDQDSHWVGQRVVGTINLGCGHCPICQKDGPAHCPNRRVLGIAAKDGAFAQHVTLPVANLLPVPDGVTDEQAVFTEPLAAAVQIREQLHLQPTARIGIVGPGRLGLLIGQVLALNGGDVTMLGRRTTSLGLPARLGLKTGLTADFDDNSFDLAVEATGNQAGFAQAIRLVRARGTLVLKSTFAGKATLDLTKLVVAELTVVGSRCGPFAPALRLLDRQEIDVTTSIEARYPLTEAIAAFDHAARPGVRKVLLHPD